MNNERQVTSAIEQHATSGLTRRAFMGAIGLTGTSILMPAWAASSGMTAAQPSTVASRHGIVAAGAQPASDAGAEILSAGGNAVDAAIATAMAMAVVDPSNTSFMGRSHILVLNGARECSAIDGRTAVPAAWQGGKKATGAGVVPACGNPRSYEEAIRRYGRLSLDQVCAPAIRLARDGFIVRSNLGRTWARRAYMLRRNATAAALFLKPDGQPYREGDTFKQPQLAESLTLYANGGAARFLEQTLDRDIEVLQRDGSQLTAQDFLQNLPIHAEHVKTQYRGWEVWTIGRQGYGYLLSQVLTLLESYDLKSLSEGDRWAVMLLAQKIAFDDRTIALGQNAPSVLDRAHVRRQAQRISTVLKSGNAAGLFSVPPQKATVPHDTTHLSVVDAQGMVASVTQSIGPHFGSAFASPGGYLFAHSYQLASGEPDADRRDVTSMLPTILRSPDGALIGVGAAGADRIRGAVIRAIVNTVDLGMSPQRAVSEPACVLHNGYVQVSSELDTSVPSRLAQMGISPRVVSRYQGEHYGLLHVARRNADGSFAAGADTYWDGGTALA